MKRVFLDASCWVAAAGSPTGGSTLILRLARAGHVRLATTRRVLQEAEHNIRTKMGEERHILTERVRKGVSIPVQDTREFLRGIAEEAEAQRGEQGAPEGVEGGS